MSDWFLGGIHEYGQTQLLMILSGKRQRETEVRISGLCRA